MKEIWQDIENYEGLYQVSNKRRVKSLGNNKKRVEKILKPRINNKGYYSVVLYKSGNKHIYLIHRLVAQAFIENPENYLIVNHKDENPINNCVENLEWCTQKHNCNYGTRNEKISLSNSKPVKCLETGTVYNSTIEAGRQTKINIGDIGACARHEKHHNTARGFHWEYIEKE